jgi:hypothetical protein
LLWLSDIARQISAGLRCVSKKSKTLQKSHRTPQKSARITPWQTSSTDGVAEKYSSCVRAPFSEVLILASAVVFTLATGESASTRPKKRRRASRLADARALPPPGQAGVRVEPRSSCRACQNGRRGPRVIQGARGTPAHDPHAAAANRLLPVPSERAIAGLQGACLSRSRRRSTASATASPIARLVSAAWGNNCTNRNLLAQACVSN